jgi:hypothetical protein
MDTRYWGSSGWRLLHAVAFKGPTLNPTKLHSFFELLPYTLPCKFCRASLTDYYAADPIPKDPNDYAHWLYRIHNRVNGKLREQKLLNTPNPAWTDIQKRYETWLKSPCTKGTMIGWDFLYSVAYTTPCADVKSTPLPDAPPNINTLAMKNRWNVMTMEERLPKLKIWWNTLPYVLPYESWQKAWLKVVPEVPHLSCGRKQVTEWLYRAEKAMCQELNANQSHDSFTRLCSELSTFSSGCGSIKSRKVKTCRAKKTHTKKRLVRQRTRRYTMTGGFL